MDSSWRVINPDDGMQCLTVQELTTRAERIRGALAAAFAPTELEVVDESHLHAGHAGARPEGETHFSVRIRSPRLDPLSRVERHRAVNAALAPEFANGLHALALKIEAAGDVGGR
jgi:BolA family transcriptional regulator, general stress-responsive regulator